MADSANFELVSFDRPPVEEIAFAVQLVEPVLSIEDIVGAGACFSADFPVHQLQPPLPRMFAPAAVPSFSISTIGVQVPRFWFVSSDGLKLIQLQEDRIAFNWRRLGTDAVYPRYAVLRQEFESVLAQVAQAVGFDLGTLQSDLCELTYVNELEHGADSSLDAALTTVSPLSDADFLPPPDEARWTGQWTITQATGPAGRMTVAAQPAVRDRDQRPINLLSMACTLPGEVVGLGEVLSRMDVAHEWIVKGFADLTTAEMHETWSRTK
ncbi:MAG: TIGR04255 family protein [Solirubrobacteraceae bacterium]